MFEEDTESSCDDQEDSEFESEYECIHEFIDENGVCCNCHISLERNVFVTNDIEYENAINHRNMRSDFEKDLAPLKCISQEVKLWISDYATSSIKSVCRLKNRKERIIAYIILASYILKTPFNRNEVIRELKATKSNMNEAFKYVSALSQKALPQPEGEAISILVVIEQPIIYLDKNLSKLNNNFLNERKDEISKLITNLTQESNFILEEAAEDMCIAIIKFYMDRHKFDTNKIHIQFNAKPKKINESYQVVIDVYNQMIKKYKNTDLENQKLISFPTD